MDPGQAAPVAAEPVKVRLKEGNTRGFLALRPPGGDPIAYGELVQKPAGKFIANRLQLNFKDGSVYDETVTFSQDGLFRLEAYRLTQRGPSFPLTEVAFDRRSGRYTARTQDGKQGKVEAASGELEMPADLYNGMALTLLKNLPARATAAAHMVVFMPKPRLIKMGLAQEGTDSARVGSTSRKANRYLVKLEVGGITGVVASLVGKEPPDLRYWLIPGEVPAFGKFEGAMFLKGPTWASSRSRSSGFSDASRSTARWQTRPGRPPFSARHAAHPGAICTHVDAVPRRPKCSGRSAIIS
jgi:hypothetical protein